MNVHPHYGRFGESQAGHMYAHLMTGTASNRARLCYNRPAETMSRR